MTVRRKRKGKGATEEIPAISVVSVKRSDGRTGESINTARRALSRKNYEEAVQLMKSVSGGGWRVQADSGDRVYTSFDAGDPKGRKTRPTWQSEYAHFLYAKALYELGNQKGEKRLLGEALLALDDLPVPGGADKQTSGGFLGRFSGGNSRFYPEALMLKAHALVGLGRFADAEKAFGELGEHAVSVPLHPKWSYEAAIGAGLIKESQGDESGAIDAYNAASGKVLAIVKREQRACLRLELGRLFSRAQVMATALKLRQAEKSSNKKALLAKLRTALLSAKPDNLRKKYRSMPKAVQDALVLGARDPMVRAVANNGIGLAFLVEKRYDEAVVPLREVTVVYFQESEQALRAHSYLAKAAAGAAKGATGDAKKMYEAMAEESRLALKGTDWENK